MKKSEATEEPLKTGANYKVAELAQEEHFRGTWFGTPNAHEHCMQTKSLGHNCSAPGTSSKCRETHNVNDIAMDDPTGNTALNNYIVLPLSLIHI